MLLAQIVVFLIGSLLIIYVSRNALKVVASHGYYRFFAWELILLLFVINLSSWFRNPSRWYQIISWILLFASLIPLFLGIITLRNGRRSDGIRSTETDLYDFERTSLLVTNGIYRYIRHPLYSSLLLLTWGIFFKVPGFIGFVIAVVTVFFLLKTAQADENECIRFFGEPYQEYMRHSKRFIPFLL